MSEDTQLPTPESFGLTGSDDLVYVRNIPVGDLEEGIETPDGVDMFYALHDATGRRLALFDNRDFAFAVARQNDLQAASAH